MQEKNSGNFAKMEGKRQKKKANPNYWVEEMRPQIMERIKYYEDYLAQWGIIAQTGIEQEFWAETATDANGNEIKHKISFYPNFFLDSPYIEKIDRDHWTKRDYDNGYELVTGTGRGKNKKEYPHPSLEPSVMVRATESANRIIAKKASEPNNKYRTIGIEFDPTNYGRRLYAQQVNISLWNRKNKQPLFDNEGMNHLSELCAQQILEAQNSMVAFYTVNNNAFRRF